MTDKEAYELLIKYSGEKGLIQQKEMLRMLGLEDTVEHIVNTMKSDGKDIKPDFVQWLHQSLKYLEIQMNKPLN